jgi:hypothetical protein
MKAGRSRRSKKSSGRWGPMPMTIEPFSILLLIGVSKNPAFFPMLNEPSFRLRFCWRRGETGGRGEASPMPGKLVFCPRLSSGIHGSVFELQLTPKETRSECHAARGKRAIAATHWEAQTIEWSEYWEGSF